ncbi:MAG: dihydropteroate synthase [Bacteroidota bacterium]|jgi:dihydropteroate synthase|nr:dihydropteroate synthase [Bacteroidota bacterium]HHU01413.1 dihydropteroate synthase [Bacteroidales bacterium]
MFLRPSQTINCRGQLIDISTPAVMGIINITPDSFFSGSRFNSEAAILERVGQIVDEGGSMVDVGAYSSRPGAENVSADIELARLLPALKVIRDRYPNLIVSVDTFRAEVAERVVTEGFADIINDISGGEMDGAMFDTVARLKVPYILMHMQGTPDTMQLNPTYRDVVADVSLWLSERVDKLRSMGVNDIIIDPGFGFGKTVEHNYSMLNRLDEFRLFQLPLLVGLSRKSMIYKVLDGDPEGSLNGTTALNTVALLKGANILRVHDVKEAVECVKLVSELKSVSKTS